MMFEGLKDSLERMKKGYCTADLINYDCFMTDFLIRSITDFLEITVSYPSQFNSFDEFHKHMMHFVQLLERLQKYDDDKYNIDFDELSEEERKRAQRNYRKHIQYVNQQREKIMKELKESDFLELILTM